MSVEHAQPVAWWQGGALHAAQPPGVSYELCLRIDADRDQSAAVAAERERVVNACIAIVSMHGGSIEIEAAIRAFGEGWT